MNELTTMVESLNSEQRARWDDLRGQRMSAWPVGLAEHVNRSRPHNGEDVMRAIAEWILQGN